MIEAGKRKHSFQGLDIARETKYLSQLANVACHRFQHLILSAKLLDPVESQDLREAHIFIRENSPTHYAFDERATRMHIFRKWDCKPEPGMPANLCYICPAEKSKDFERLASSMSIRMEWGNLPVTKDVLDWVPPENSTWVVTRISLRSIPQVNDGDLGAGDWRSFEVDATGESKAFFLVQTHEDTSNIASYIALFNHPVLFAFQGGVRVRLHVNRGILPVPAAFQAQVAVNSYLAPTYLYDCLTSNLTQVIGRFDGVGG